MLLSINKILILERFIEIQTIYSYSVINLLIGKHI